MKVKNMEANYFFIPNPRILGALALWLQNRICTQNLSVLRAFGPFGVEGAGSGLANLKTARRAKCRISLSVR